VSEDVPPYDPRLNFPATYPICGQRVVMNFQPEYLRSALSGGQPIEMWATCHDNRWPASEIERQQMHELLGDDARLGDRSVEPEDNNSDPPFGPLGSGRAES
jgi:hypothetical protein